MPACRRKNRRPILIKALAKWQFGQSRQPLAQIEDQIRKTAPADYRAIEAKLLPVLKSPETPKDAKRYICRWLAVVGSAECVPAVAELLGRCRPVASGTHGAGAAWPIRLRRPRCATPCPRSRASCWPASIGSIGIRRDAEAVNALRGLAGDSDAVIAGTAIAALGEIGTEEAVQALDGLQVPAALARTLARAQIAAASRLAAAGRRSGGRCIYQSLLQPQQPEAIRVAALKGLLGTLPRSRSGQAGSSKWSKATTRRCARRRSRRMWAAPIAR